MPVTPGGMRRLMDLRSHKIAIIGGAGFIGHHLALALAARGASVEIVDSLQVNNLIQFQADSELYNRDLYLRIIQQRLDLLRSAEIPVIVQDARDYQALNRILDRIAPNVIVHLAAVSHAGRSNKDPYSTFDHSLRTLENALDSARGRVEHFIYFSSSMVYGNFITEQVEETHPLEPVGIYGALKLAGEKIVIAYNQVFGLPYTIVRPSALYGARCVSRRVGQVFIESAMNRSKLVVEGDGSDRLDFTFIDDLVDGMCLVIKDPAARGEIFNLTFGRSRSIAELLEVILDHFPDAKVEHVKRDALMPFRGTLSVEKARRMLGYEPRAPLEVGMARYIDWYRSLGDLVPTTVAS